MTAPPHPLARPHLTPRKPLHHHHNHHPPRRRLRRRDWAVGLGEGECLVHLNIDVLDEEVGGVNEYASPGRLRGGGAGGVYGGGGEEG